MADNKQTVEIAFVTTADPAGAEQEIKIIDTVKTKVVANNEEFAAWQASLAEARAGRTSAMASDIVMESDLAEREARQEAARLSNEASMFEAQKIRFAQAKAAAEAQAAADLEQVMAAREKLALESVAAEKTLANAAFRAATPRNRELAAVQRIANNPAALDKLGSLASGLVGPWGLAAAAVASGALAFHAASKSADELVTAGEGLGLNMEQLKLAAHPLSAAFTDMGEGSMSLLHTALDALTLGTLSATQATTKEALAHVQAAESMRHYVDIYAQWKSMVDSDRSNAIWASQLNFLKLVNQEMEGNLKLLREKDSLEAAREKRSGASEGAQAVGGLNRLENEQASEVAIAEQKLEAAKDAEKLAAEELVDLQKKTNYAKGEFDKAKEQNQPKEIIDQKGALLIDAQKNQQAGEGKERSADLAVKVATKTLDFLTKENALKITEKAEEGQAKITEEAAKADSDLAAKGIALIEQAKQKHAGQQSDLAAQLEAALQPIAEHATGTAEENKRVTEIIRQFTQTSDAKDAEILKGMWDLITIAQATRTEIASMQQAIKDLQNWQADKINAPTF